MSDPPPHADAVPMFTTHLHDPMPGTVVAWPTGEVDMVSAPVLRRDLEQLLRHRSRVVVDLDGVTFLGSHGVRALLEVHERAVAAGVELFVTGATGPAVHRVLQLTGLLHVLPVVEEDAEALLKRLEGN